MRQPNRCQPTKRRSLPALATGAVALGLLVAAAAPSRSAQERADWPQFRGPGRDGVVSATLVPRSWPAHLRRVWSTSVGAGYASPLAVGGRLYVHARRDQTEVVMALDESSGAEVWRDSYPAPSTKTPEYAASEGEGPYATPVLASGRLYTLGVHGVVSAYAASDGGLVWRRDLGAVIVETQRFCGVAPSPLLVDDTLIVQVGDDDTTEISALATATGETVWTWSGPATGNASPSLVELDGVPQIVAMTDESVVGLDPAAGALLWQHPFAGVPGSCSTNIPTPTAVDGNLVVSGVRPGTRAISVRKEGATWRTDVVWENESVKPMWSNMVAFDGILFGVSQQRRGQLFALDASTGEAVWMTEGRSGENAAVLVAGDAVLFLMNDAELRVVRRTRDGYDQLAAYDVGDTTVWAYPVVRQSGLLVKAGETLTLWGF